MYLLMLYIIHVNTYLLLCNKSSLKSKLNVPLNTDIAPCSSCRFGKRYELPLLLQSIIMILAMFVMIKLCINVQNRTQIIKSKERVLTGKYNLIIADILQIPIYTCIYRWQNLYTSQIWMLDSFGNGQTSNPTWAL